ncbi:MAG: nucleotide disphospho-sugar-binding domain-containing protein [Sphingomonadaceae bacterium]
MAHILLGWEYGGGSGHTRKLVQIAERLKESGHRVSYALKQVGSIGLDRTQGAAVLPTPQFPNALAPMPKRKRRPHHTLGDIFVALGLGDPAATAAVLSSWRDLLKAAKPDIVVAEYAPTLLLAARGRYPTVATGTGFSLPPAAMPRFPSLTGKPPTFNEANTLAAVNKALERLGDEPLESLPAIYAATRSVVASFPELDHYRQWRKEPRVAPTIPVPRPEPSSGEGEEVFVYSSTVPNPEAAIWKALEASKLPVRIYLPGIGPPYRGKLEARGFKVEPRPLSFPEIGKRSRILLSHGGCGFVSSGLLTGLPQVVCHLDLEKMMQGRAVKRLGIGGFVAMRNIKPEPFAENLRKIWHNDNIRNRARNLAATVAAREQPEMEASIAAAVEELA